MLGEGEPEHAGCMDNPRSCTENESCQPISRGQGILPQKTIFWRGCPNTQIGLWKSLVDWSPLSLGGHSSFPWTLTNNFPPPKVLAFEKRNHRPLIFFMHAPKPNRGLTSYCKADLAEGFEDVRWRGPTKNRFGWVGFFSFDETFSNPRIRFPPKRWC